MILIFAGPQFLSPKKEDPWTLVRRLEARLAQEKFYYEKTKTESQYEVKVNGSFDWSMLLLDSILDHPAIYIFIQNLFDC